MWAIGFAIFVLGVVFVIVAPINKKKNARCSTQAHGMLMDILKRENSDEPLPDIYVYSYSVDGIEYQLKSTVYNKQVNAVGDHCTIWYNPKKPKDAQPLPHCWRVGPMCVQSEGSTR